MNLRLVLVCLVAGLGIGIPSRPDIEGWIASPRHRMQARVAESGENRTHGGDHATIREFRRFGTDGPLMARPWRIAPAFLESSPVAHPAEPGAPAHALPSHPQTPVVAAATSPEITPPPSFDPIEVDDRMYVGIAHDLNYFGEGLGMLPRAEVPSNPPLSTVRLDELVELAAVRHGAGAFRLAGRLGRDLNAFAARELARESFLAMEESPDLYFDELLAEPKPADIAATEPKPAVASAPSAFDAMERSESLYFAENPTIEAPESPAVVVATDLPALPADPFAPADAIDEPAAVVVATDLPALPADPFAPVDAIDEPAAVVADSRRAEPKPARGGDVTRAVRLTGQALAAWVNVFTKAPLVAASPAAASIR